MPPPWSNASLSPLQQPDPVVGHTQGAAQYLGEGAFMALAEILRTGDEGDPAVGLEPDAARLLARRGGRFEITGDTYPAYQAARFRCRPVRAAKPAVSAAASALSSTAPNSPSP